MQNFKKIFAVKKENEKRIKVLCPNIENKSGIYIWYRKDTNGIIWTYIGQAENLLDRSIQHSMGYSQRLDISIKKRGLFSKENPNGWNLKILEFTRDLDNREQFWILHYMQKGYQSYNNESGGNSGKEIYENKDKKGYRTGLNNGYKKCLNDIKRLFKRIDFSPKSEKVLDKRFYEKFKELLKEE